MGTRVGKLVLLCVVLCLGLSPLAWTAEEEVAVTAPATPLVVAQAPAVVTVINPACPPETQGVTENVKGTAYFYDDKAWEVWVTIGSRHGLRPTAQVEFVRCDEVIAQGTVKKVRDSDCVVTPCPGTPAGTILLGDDVRVRKNGTRAALDRVTNRERKLEMLGTLVFSALIWWPSL